MIGPDPDPDPYDEPLRPWAQTKSEYRNKYAPKADDDFMGHMPANARFGIARDPRSLSSTPYDGIGLVDDAGNPIDKSGNPEDRSVLEGKYDALLLSRPGPTTT